MNPRPVDATGPRIDIRVSSTGVDISQHRPAVVSSLVGKPVATALSLVPLLLPICGHAQSVAARRAVAAARAEPAEPGQRLADACLLWREQALAAAWRCTVDWPDLLGEPRQMAMLKRARSAKTDLELGVILRQLLPGLEDVTGIDSLLDWVGRGGSTPAAVARLAMDTREKPVDTDEAHGATLDTLVQAAATALAQEPFEPLDPAGGPLEVGPRVMTRDALVAEVRREVGFPILSRILALALDMRVIYRALLAAAQEDVDGCSVADRPGTGLGCALTARGPVFHRVTLGPGDTVADWRALAPTDWHFGPGGPVQLALGDLDTPASMRLLVASYDPCAPWSICADRGKG